MAFSPTIAAFEGFRLIRREPRAVLVWLAAGTVCWMAAMALSFAVAWPVMGPVWQNAYDASPLDWNAIAPRIPVMIVVNLVFAVVLAGGLSVLLNAVARAVLRPDDRRAAYLRLGADEIRTGAAYLILMGLAMASMLALIALLGGAYLTTRSLAATGVAGMLLMPGLWVLWIWSGVRLSLLLPMAADTGRISLRRAWRLTRGRFWPLLGMAVIIYALTSVVGLFLQSFLLVGMQGLAWGPPAAGEQTLTQMLASEWPTLTALLALMAFMTVLQMVLGYAPFVAAYRALSATPPAPHEGPPVAGP